MIGFLIRIVLALTALYFNTLLFVTGYWGWGITMIFLTALIILSFFRNENMILAMNQMRLRNNDKAKKHINRITHPQFLTKRQHAYVLYLQALLNAQDWTFSKTEGQLRKALQLGLKQAQDQAMCRIHLAGICAQTGRGNESKILLAEAKKLDKDNVFKDHIKNMTQQLGMVSNKNQMRMAMMHKGRVKMPRGSKRQ